MVEVSVVSRGGGDPRRQLLLEAAISTFLRYGYRKTSMEEVARAAQISRPGLYLHFPTKEALFHAAVTHTLDKAVETTTEILAGEGPIEARLVDAFDAWIIGAMGDTFIELREAGRSLVGAVVRERLEQFVDAITKALRACGLAAHYRAAGLGARDVAETLLAVVQGLKVACETREELRRRCRIAVRVICLPLRSE